MDQLTVSELHSSIGIGNFKYGIISNKLDTDIWWFALAYTKVGGVRVPLPTIS